MVTLSGAGLRPAPTVHREVGAQISELAGSAARRGPYKIQFNSAAQIFGARPCGVCGAAFIM
jgi:hypothetical protein